MRIVLLGGPGSGKGTQGERLAAHFSIPRISTGDELRTAVAAGTALGERAKAAMDAGELVADDIAIGVIEQGLRRKDTHSGFVLDGFPRTVRQAQMLDSLLREGGLSTLNWIIHLDVSDDVTVNRLLNRATLENRADDREDVIRNRLRVYRAEVRPLLEYYNAQGKVVTVEGEGSIDSIYQRILRAIR